MKSIRNILFKLKCDKIINKKYVKVYNFKVMMFDLKLSCGKIINKK